MKVIPQRTCIVCKTKQDKNTLIRIVRNTEGNFVLDKTGKVNGRGAYICNNRTCIEKCAKTHALNRAFKQEITPSVYDTLIRQYDGQN